MVIRISDGDVMWQKEALLNVALDQLPSAARYVAWLDCDVLFERKDWCEAARDALCRSSLVQLFTELHDLLPNGTASPLPPVTGRGIAGMRAAGIEPETAFRPTEAAHMRRNAFGLAWAAEVALMRTHRFYDAMVIGSGDRALACAAFGFWEDAARSLKLTIARTHHYRSWACAFHDAVRGRVGAISGRLLHLWHGEIEDRAYAERHSRFGEMPFDPLQDLARCESGLWRWARDRKDIRDFMINYFTARQEDGRLAR